MPIKIDGVIGDINFVEVLYYLINKRGFINYLINLKIILESYDKKELHIYEIAINLLEILNIYQKI